MKNIDVARAKWMKVRIAMLTSILGLCVVGLLASAYRIQIQEGATWKQTAEKQRERKLRRASTRGTIFDRHGVPVAVSVDVPIVSVDVVEMLSGIDHVKEQDEFLNQVSKTLGETLHLNPGEVYEKLSQRKRYVPLKRQITSEEIENLSLLTDNKKQSQALRGINIEGEGKRFYPGRKMLGTVLGFVAPDGLGKDGLELSLDEELRGKTSEVRGLRDRAGRLLFDEGVETDSLAEGNDVELSIDEGIQHFAERELDAALRTYEAKGGVVVVMVPNTGEILALSSSPGYNPNDYGTAAPDVRRDRAVTDRFEPGSAMKAFTFAAAFAKNALRSDEKIDCENGSYKIGRLTIHDTHSNGLLTPTEILAKSSNIGTLKVALRLGEAELYSAFRRFGFGEPTGLPLPGETHGVLRPKGRPWFDVETANASFGQGISVSAVQLAMAMGAIANQGRLMEPLLVRKVVDARGQTVREQSPRVRREVVPPWVAAKVTTMLTAVTKEGGTGTEAAILGFDVAGKTATAQKADPRTGRYSMDKYTASFVGFVPAHKPRVLVVAVLDEPGVGRYGGDLAGPLFRRVAEASLRALGVGTHRSLAGVDVEPQKNDPADLAVKILSPSSLDQGGSRPPSENDIFENPDALKVTGPNPLDLVMVPKLIGLGVRDAISGLSKVKLVPVVTGSGKLVRTIPNSGASLPKGALVHLVFEPES